ncbi:MAG: hypothetical protein JSU72_17920 [Deltaproteobacteria bacterium]|nr:MAG: hypothetical protein JSU72_17920 [Deltaproteobacteria bacterium]
MVQYNAMPGFWEWMVLLVISIVFLGVPCSIAAYFLAKVKRRSPAVWMPICLFLSIIGLLLLAILPKGNVMVWDGETRCRKCGYILKGIPEPRCSECGERI